MVKDYKYNDNLDLKDVDYINVNEMDGRLNDTEYSTHFKQDIYKNASGVQIPIEIYEGCKLVSQLDGKTDLKSTFESGRRCGDGAFIMLFVHLFVCSFQSIANLNFRAGD